MKALILKKPEQFELIEIEKPKPVKDEVLVQIKCCGICKSDIEAYYGTRPMSLIKYPVILGHEWSGEVVEVGDSVRAVVPGEHVVAQGVVFCGYCRNCIKDRNLCESYPYEEYGFTLPGGFAEFIKIPERQLHKIPKDLSFEESVLFEPAACSYAGVLRSGIIPGDTVAVIGPGAIGLLAILYFRLYNPSQIFIIGTRDDRNSLGLNLGATKAINIRKENPVEIIKKSTDGRGVDIVFESAGTSDAVGLAFDIVAKEGGTVVLEGVAGEGKKLEINSDLFVLKDITVRGILGYTKYSFSKAIELMVKNKLDFKSLITHRFNLTEYKKAFETVIDRRGEKIVIGMEEKGT